jgi:hypothetical protein
MLAARKLSQLTDETVLAETKRLALSEQTATADLVAMLAELDSRKLFLVAGYNSLFSYCTDELHLSEDATYARIEVARVSRAFPLVLALVSDGSLSLTNARLLAPLLTAENHLEILRRAQHRKKRDVERMIAELRPRPDVVPMVRRLPENRPMLEQVLPEPQPPSQLPERMAVLPAPFRSPARPVFRHPRSSGVAPLSPERFKVQFTADQETHDLLRRAQALARHTVPSGELPLIFKLALRSFVSDLERKKAGIVAKPRTSKPARRGSRYIPRDIRRAVWQRDEARCAFEGPRGRCPERDCLEFHHLRPFAHGGPTTVQNLELRCRTHNVLEHQSMIE